ncbi:enterochelin esterase [Allokutzneria oryzae]|uniref:Enterochelin esterase n=1 Tax=Allokutzneria oryzae TaxID=1378989 RepID=A0ABV5ZPH0_9PSEU
MNTLLEELAATGDQDAFWARVAELGTPLVEPDGDGHHRVTLLWRDRGEGTRAVLASVNTLTDRQRHRGDLGPSLLSRMPGTDVWHIELRLRADLRATYQMFAFDDRDPGLDPARIDRAAWRKLLDIAEPDPLNPVRFPNKRGAPMSSVLELPEAPPHPWWRPRDVPAGAVTEHRVRSEILGNERTVWVYAPPGRPTGPLPVLVLLDGDVWGPLVPIRATIDNLVAEGLVPPMVVLMPDVIDRDHRLRELACHEPFVRFLADELLPWARRGFPVTSRASETVIAGQSFGGLTAAYAGLVASSEFGVVLSQSGSFWWPEDSLGNDEEWLSREFARSPRLPVRFYLEAGLLEWMLLAANRHLRTVLEAKGYDVIYREYLGGHDYVCWRGGIADGLIALFGGCTRDQGRYRRGDGS